MPRLRRAITALCTHFLVISSLQNIALMRMPVSVCNISSFLHLRKLVQSRALSRSRSRSKPKVCRCSDHSPTYFRNPKKFSTKNTKNVMILFTNLEFFRKIFFITQNVFCFFSSKKYFLIFETFLAIWKSVKRSRTLCIMLQFVSKIIALFFWFFFWKFLRIFQDIESGLVNHLCYRCWRRIPGYYTEI